MILGGLWMLWMWFRGSAGGAVVVPTAGFIVFLIGRFL